jgi:hypothetical protein
MKKAVGWGAAIVGRRIVAGCLLFSLVSFSIVALFLFCSVHATFTRTSTSPTPHPQLSTYPLRGRFPPPTPHPTSPSPPPTTTSTLASSNNGYRRTTPLAARRKAPSSSPSLSGVASHPSSSSAPSHPSPPTRSARVGDSAASPPRPIQAFWCSDSESPGPLTSTKRASHAMMVGAVLPVL